MVNSIGLRARGPEPRRRAGLVLAFIGTHGVFAAGPTNNGLGCSATHAQVTDVTYTISGTSGTSTTTHLRDHAASGDTVTAHFKVTTTPSTGCVTMSLVSYQAPLPHFTTASAPQQNVFQQVSRTFKNDETGSLRVTLPTCFYHKSTLSLGVPSGHLQRPMTTT